MTTENFINAGRMRDENTELGTTTFTPWGIVYACMKPADDKAFKGTPAHPELGYFTHYAIVRNGRLWRTKSWGGAMTPRSITLRSNEFARRVARLDVDEARESPVPPTKKDEQRAARLESALNSLVDLVLYFIEHTFPRMGMVWSCWEDYPLQLRDAMALLGRKGGNAGIDNGNEGQEET